MEPKLMYIYKMVELKEEEMPMRHPSTLTYMNTENTDYVFAVTSGSEVHETRTDCCTEGIDWLIKTMATNHNDSGLEPKFAIPANASSYGEMGESGIKVWRIRLSLDEEVNMLNKYRVALLKASK